MSKQDPAPVWGKLRPRKVAGESTKSENLLEVLSALKVPDGVLTVFLTFLSALTLAPYLGGRALWILGGSPVVIPTLSEHMFWTIVIITPFLWLFAVVRLFHASPIKVFYALLLASLVAIGMIALHSTYPTIGLTAIDSSFTEEHELSAWYLTASHQGHIYKYFRSVPIPLGVDRGCALRVELIEVSAGGWANVENLTSGFDIQVFASSSKLLPPTFKSQQDRLNSGFVDAAEAIQVRQEPASAEVKGRASVEVSSDYLMNTNSRIKLNIVYDFKSLTARIEPREYSRKRLERRDMVVSGLGGRVQVVGWTLYGEDVGLTINDPIVRISGKVHCPFSVWLKQQTTNYEGEGRE